MRMTPAGCTERSFSPAGRLKAYRFEWRLFNVGMSPGASSAVKSANDKMEVTTNEKVYEDMSSTYNWANMTLIVKVVNDIGCPCAIVGVGCRYRVLLLLLYQDLMEMATLRSASIGGC